MPILETRYDFGSKELIFHFPTADLATKYQRKNQEGRILAKEATDVLVPVISQMKDLRACKQGMIIRFKTEQAAVDWKGQSIVGRRKHPDHSVGAKEVLLQRVWKDEDLEAVLSGRKTLD